LKISITRRGASQSKDDHGQEYQKAELDATEKMIVPPDPVELPVDGALISEIGPRTESATRRVMVSPSDDERLCRPSTIEGRAELPSASPE
jgi:hypothetical protein